jgi:hypothetical protein
MEPNDQITFNTISRQNRRSKAKGQAGMLTKSNALRPVFAIGSINPILGVPAPTRDKRSYSRGFSRDSGLFAGATLRDLRTKPDPAPPVSEETATTAIRPWVASLLSVRARRVNSRTAEGGEHTLLQSEARARSAFARAQFIQNSCFRAGEYVRSSRHTNPHLGDCSHRWMAPGVPAPVAGNLGRLRATGPSVARAAALVRARLVGGARRRGAGVGV